MRFNEILLLSEWEEDLKRGNALLHYTDIEGLIKILKSGFISKRWYQFNHYTKSKKNDIDDLVDLNNGKKISIADPTLDQETRKKQFGEIALVRPSSSQVKTNLGSTQEKEWVNQAGKAQILKKLSDKDFIAEFILYVDNIKSGVRNVKQNKINEFVIRAYKTTRFYIEEITKYLAPKWDGRDIVLNMEMKLSSSYKGMDYVLDNWKKLIKELLIVAKNIKEKNDQIRFYISRIDEALKQYKQYTTTERESEERLTQDIPLKSKFVQIRLLSPIFNEKKETKKELLELIKKNKNLFVIDSTFSEFLEQVTTP